MRLRWRSKRLLMLRSREASDAIRQQKVPIIALFAIITFLIAALFSLQVRGFRMRAPFLLLVAIFLMGCTSGTPTFFNTTQNNTAISNASASIAASTCIQFQNASGERDECLRSSALSSGDWRVCRQIADAEKKDNCYYEIALETKNSVVCAQMLSPSSRQYCRSDLSQNATVCMNVPLVGKAECFNDFAMQKNDSKYCGEIAEISGHDDCYYNLALLLQRGELCAQMAGSRKDECLAKFAIAEKNATYCDGMVGGTGRNCLLEVAELKIDPLLCGKIEKNSVERDSCYLFMADYKRTYTYCGNVADQVKRDDCYAEFARKDKNVSICLNQLTKEQRLIESCIYDVALSSRNSTYCDIIFTNTVHNFCVSALSAGR